MEQKLLTTTQVLNRAKEQGISCNRYTLERWIAEGAFPVIRSGNRAYIYWPNFVNFVIGGKPTKTSES